MIAGQIDDAGALARLAQQLLHDVVVVLRPKAGKRVASFDLHLNQLTLTRYLRNRHEWDRKHEQKLCSFSVDLQASEIGGIAVLEFGQRECGRCLVRFPNVSGE